jgi:hypothetical protein
MLLPPQLARPEALRVLHMGGYWRGQNDMVRNMMLGLRAAGADVYELCTDDHLEALDTEGRIYDRGTSGPVWLRSEHIQPIVDSFQPQLIICNATGLAFRPEDAASLRRRHCLLGIALSDPDVFEVATRHIAPTFDRFLTLAPECLPWYRALGVDAGLLPVATNDLFFRPVPPRPEYVCDVLMLGRAHDDRVEPIRALAERFDVHVYGEEWERYGIASRGFVYGEDSLAALNSARMTVVFFRTLSGHPLIKVQAFNFAAAGALVVTNRFDALARYFDYGEEIIGFDSTEELVAQVGHYLAHPEAAERIRLAGRARVLRDHTWPRVWPGVLASLAAPAA